MATVGGMDNDTTFKRIFSHQIMVRELLDWFVGRLLDGRETVDNLDLSKLRRASEQTVGRRPRGPPPLRRRHRVGGSSS